MHVYTRFVIYIERERESVFEYSPIACEIYVDRAIIYYNPKKVNGSKISY